MAKTPCQVHKHRRTLSLTTPPVAVPTARRGRQEPHAMTTRINLIPVFFLLCLLGATHVRAQQHKTASLANPFAHDIRLSGNFMEIRSNHFHAGLDFKTQGVSGKPMRALADGYISRARVTHGSGYVLHVHYDGGLTAVCRHLEAFEGRLAQEIKDLQYARESWEVDLTLEPDAYPVKAGQIIARAGNTGYSFGPHLHLELVCDSTGRYIDPLPYFAADIDDRVPPRAVGVMLFPQAGRGVVNGSSRNQSFSPDRLGRLQAWGEVGIGLRAYDYMGGVHNRYGVYRVVMHVDSQEVFRSVMDGFTYDQNRYINSWTHGQYMKSFIEPGNRLPQLTASNGNRGLLTIDEERPYHIQYTLTDRLGNTTRFAFTLHGKRQSIPSLKGTYDQLLRWNRVNYLQHAGLSLTLPKGVLYDNVRLRARVYTLPGHTIAPVYCLSERRIPLHRACPVSIPVVLRHGMDTTKLYVAGVSGRGKLSYVGGRYKHGRMEASLSSLGSYTVAIDTVPPSVEPVNLRQWGRRGRITLQAKDAETGIWQYRATIDGRYALMGKPNALRGELVCVLDPEHVQRGREHTLEVTVSDGLGNETTRRFRFRW